MLEPVSHYHVSCTSQDRSDNIVTAHTFNVQLVTETAFQTTNRRNRCYGLPEGIGAILHLIFLYTLPPPRYYYRLYTHPAENHVLQVEEIYTTSTYVFGLQRQPTYCPMDQSLAVACFLSKSARLETSQWGDRTWPREESPPSVHTATAQNTTENFGDNETETPGDQPMPPFLRLAWLTLVVSCVNIRNNKISKTYKTLASPQKNHKKVVILPYDANQTRRVCTC